MPAAKFQPIEILKPTTKDQKKTRVSSKDARLSDSFFQLSAKPDHEWYKIFCEVMVKRMKKTTPSNIVMADIEGRQLKITCKLEHLPEHFKNMQSDIDTINQEYQAELDKEG